LRAHAPLGFRDRIPATSREGSGLILTYLIGITPKRATGRLVIDGELTLMPPLPDSAGVLCIDAPRA
jgi:hypothetical protein